MGANLGSVAAIVCIGSTALTVVRPPSSSHTATEQGRSAPIPSSAVSAWWAYLGLHAPRIW